MKQFLINYEGEKREVFLIITTFPSLGTRLHAQISMGIEVFLAIHDSTVTAKLSKALNASFSRLFNNIYQFYVTVHYGLCEDKFP